MSNHPQINAADAIESLNSLVENGLLLVEKSPEAERDEDYFQHWQMGTAAALLHFSANDNDYVTVEESTRLQIDKNLARGGPALSWVNSKTALQLPTHCMPGNESLFSVLQMRRTIRNAKDQPLELEQVADLLKSGFAITGYAQTEVGHVLLKMAPSGGGRNPFEAYLIVRNIKGISP